ncbi:helix-turn-helix domain-containing protein [Actinopolymorpha sp. NPDC004070]|uniref:helix-turn-helix domain-containing protein n=1 Tax=Actinopolymorpha sp. NPDC004070 TaxID=3154548 RepID=UPI0033B7DDFF
MNDAVLTVYTPEEAAEVLRVGQSWLEQQAAARRVPFTMLGGCYRFTDDHLVQIVQIFESTPAASSRVAYARDGLPVTEHTGTRAARPFAVNVVESSDRSDSGPLALAVVPAVAAVAEPGETTGAADAADKVEETNVATGVDVPADPIFVDSTGRRARNVRRVGYLVAGLCAMGTAALGVSLTGVTPMAPRLVPPPAVASAAPLPSASSVRLQKTRSAANRKSSAPRDSGRTRQTRSRPAPERSGPSPTAANSSRSSRDSRSQSRRRELSRSPQGPGRVETAFPSGSDGTDRPTYGQP